MEQTVEVALHFLRECRIHYNIKSSRHYFVGRPVCVLVVAIVVITWSINLKLCKYNCAKKEKTREAEAWHFRGWGIFFTHFQIILNKKNTSFESKRRPPPPTPSKNQRWAALSWRSYVLAKVFVTSYCRCAWIFRLQVFFSWILWSVLCYVVYVSMLTTSWIGIPVPKRFCIQYFGMT